MDLTLTDMEPFLPPLTTDQTTRAEAWASVLGVLLGARYGDRITDALRPAFASAAADAIVHRFSRPVGSVVQQSVGGASVRYDKALLSWFSSEQLAELDLIVGGGGVRSVRMRAPDGVRDRNRFDASDYPVWG